ncbi:MAG: M48 family metalloprotease [Microscillaceae bacterium]|nr:M48 family metalloprotease [Microscillaceae bacterium]
MQKRFIVNTFKGIVQKLFFGLTVIFIINSCAPGGPQAFNAFSLQDDIAFGQQLSQEIANSPKEYPLLDRTRYAKAYQILEDMKNEILNSGYVSHKDDFEWKLHIIHNDTTLNAFVSPGGYIYVYTGLIKYLDTEDQLAGVMGHEIAHAERRHSTTNMTKQYGLAALIEIISGQNTSQLSQLVGGLIGLKFNRTTEADADAQSVLYLSKTKYQCNGAAGFFEKLLSEGNAQEPPQFLSTHPSSANRVQDINAKATEMGCSTKPSGSNYQLLKNSIP